MLLASVMKNIKYLIDNLMKPTSLYFLILLTAGLIVSSCNESSTNRSASDRADAVSQDFNWKTANVYFLLTDRFNKGN